MKILKDKQGNKLTRKEFMERWKKGIEMITPLQQVTFQIRSTWIMLVGVVCGIGISLYAIDTLWWLLFILVGALGNTGVQQIGLYQKRIVFEKQNEMFNIHQEGLDKLEEIKNIPKEVSKIKGKKNIKKEIEKTYRKIKHK